MLKGLRKYIRDVKLVRFMSELSPSKGGSGRYINPTELLKQNDVRKRFIDFLVADSDIKDVLVIHSIPRERLNDIYHSLILAGAGQWVGGVHVASFSIAQPGTLSYILRQIQKVNYETTNAYWEMIVLMLINHYEGGELQEL